MYNYCQTESCSTNISCITYTDNVDEILYQWMKIPDSGIFPGIFSFVLENDIYCTVFCIDTNNVIVGVY